MVVAVMGPIRPFGLDLTRDDRRTMAHGVIAVTRHTIITASGITTVKCPIDQRSRRT